MKTAQSPIILTIDDSLLQTLPFKRYRSSAERQVQKYLPGPDEPETLEIVTPWGARLMLNRGDYLVSELNKPEDRWPVNPEIFESTYIITSPGHCTKSATTDLVPLTEVTGGDEDREVTIRTLEGAETVRAGSFYLARGIKGEIWAIPREKVEQTLTPVA